MHTKLCKFSFGLMMVLATYVVNTETSILRMIIAFESLQFELNHVMAFPTIKIDGNILGLRHCFNQWVYHQKIEHKLFY